MQKIAVITGVTGCIGYHVAKKLSEQGWQVISLHRKSSRISNVKDLNIIHKEVDFFSRKSLENAIPEKIDVFFHIAADLSHTYNKEQEIFNVTVTETLADICLSRKARFIFTSTGATLPFEHDYDENKLRSEIKVGYILTKRLAEVSLHKKHLEGLDLVTLHPIIVLGTHDFHNNYGQLFTNPLPFSLPGKIYFCDAKLVADAHIGAYTGGKNNIPYVLGGAYLSWFDLQKKIASVTKKQEPLFVTPFWIILAFSYVNLITHKIFNKRPRITPELVMLLKDKDGTEGITPDDEREARIDLGYNMRETDIEKTIQEVHEWQKTYFKTKKC